MNLDSIAPSGRMDRLTMKRAGKTLPWQPDRRQLFILPTRGGIILGIALLFMLLGSLNYNNNLAIALTFFMTSCLLVSAIWTHRHLQDCRLLELQALPVHAGESLKIRLFWQPPETSYLPEIQGLNLQVARHDNHIDLLLPTHHRGWLKLPPLKLTSRYPLGLFVAWSWWRYSRKLLIWPAVEIQPPPLPRLQTVPAKSNYPFSQGDLTELQRWQAGDPMSRVAWKILARHGQWLSRHPEGENESHGPLLLREEDTGLRDREAAISRLTAWILEAERLSIPYGLELRGQPSIAPALGEAHLTCCLERLALA